MSSTKKLISLSLKKLQSKYASLSLALLIHSVGYCYWEDIPYKEDVREHKEEFYHWIESRALWDAYARIILTVSCTDTDNIPKCPHAGKVFDLGEATPYQLMHNGIKVIKDGYCAAWMTDLIYGLKGHHEPQEERVFYEVLKHIPPKAVMLELGSYWGYYSLWFAKEIKDATNYLIEPDPNRLNLGRKNFELNQLSASFIRGYFGTCGTDAGDFVEARQLFIDTFLEDYHINHVHILHADIQGSEYEMLESSIKAIKHKQIDYFFISTHSHKIHFDCIHFLKGYDYDIIAEHTPAESYSVDGLVVAKKRSLAYPNEIKISKNE